MSFFERNRAELIERGYDPARLPPGQYLTDRFPVLHVGDVPTYAPGEWTLTVSGLVDAPFTVDLGELRALPAVNVTTDIHCVTKWSKFDTTWTGVRVRDLLERAGARTDATHVLAHAEYGYSTNLPRADATTDSSLVATPTEAKTSSPSTVARSVSSSPTSTSGSRPSGSEASSCWPTMLPGSGSRTATTTRATRSASSGSGATEALRGSRPRSGPPKAN
jgi:hypothetical protein